MLTHVHTCKHCDTTWNCKIENCVFQRDVSKYHDCHERELAAMRMRKLFANFRKCQYGCRSLPCVHDKWADKPGQKLGYKYDRVRPRMVEINGKWQVVCAENAVSMANELAADEQRKRDAIERENSQN